MSMITDSHYIDPYDYSYCKACDCVHMNCVPCEEIYKPKISDTFLKKATRRVLKAYKWY